MNDNFKEIFSHEIAAISKKLPHRMEHLFSVKDAAQFLDTTEEIIYTQICIGALSVLILNDEFGFLRSELEKYNNNNKH